VEVCGVTIPKGESAVLYIGTANRDPHQYSDPDTFDLPHSDLGHMTFGGGIYGVCAHIWPDASCAWSSRNSTTRFPITKSRRDNTRSEMALGHHPARLAAPEVPDHSWPVMLRLHIDNDL
jgi:hypothetical protein